MKNKSLSLLVKDTIFKSFLGNPIPFLVVVLFPVVLVLTYNPNAEFSWDQAIAFPMFYGGLVGILTLEVIMDLKSQGVDHQITRLIKWDNMEGSLFPKSVLLWGLGYVIVSKFCLMIGMLTHQLTHYYAFASALILMTASYFLDRRMGRK